MLVTFIVVLFLISVVLVVARTEAARRGARSGSSQRVIAGRLEGTLDPGEQPEVIAGVAIAAKASGDKVVGIGRWLPTRLGEQIGTRIMRVGTVRGGKGSIAASIRSLPKAAKIMVLTNQRLCLWNGREGRPEDLAWSVARSEVASVHTSPRLQLASRFRVRFADGSSAVFMTVSSTAPTRLAAALEGRAVDLPAPSPEQAALERAAIADHGVASGNRAGARPSAGD